MDNLLSLFKTIIYRRAQHTIWEIKRANGSIIHDSENIKTEVICHFHTLFSDLGETSIIDEMHIV